MAFISIPLTDVDAKSPLSEALLTLIKTNLDDLDTRVSAGVAGPSLSWRVNGHIDAIPVNDARRLDSLIISKEREYTQARAVIEARGLSGDLEVDIRKYSTPRIGVEGIDAQYNAVPQSITSLPTIAIQSISRVTPQINTQSITFLKPTVNIQEILVLADGEVRIKLASDIEVETFYEVGDNLIVTNATAGGNNGVFAILRFNDDDGVNVIISNVTGVNQATVTGEVRLEAVTYDQLNPLAADFVVGEFAVCSGHTSGANDGQKTIEAVNEAGNNFVVKNGGVVEQGGIAGSVDADRLIYAFVAAAPTPDFTIDERVNIVGATTPQNNGTKIIKAINTAGNNVTLRAGFTALHTPQAGIAGTVRSLRRTVDLLADPSSDVTVGDIIFISGTGSIFDSPTGYEVVQINRNALDNLVFASGITGFPAVGIGGDVTSELKIVSLNSDPTADDITTASKVEIVNLVDENLNGYLEVFEVNRGAVNNIVVKVDGIAIQTFTRGRIDIESKSLFSDRPVVTFDRLGFDIGIDAGVIDLVAADISDGATIGIEILQVPDGLVGNVYIELF